MMTEQTGIAVYSGINGVMAAMAKEGIGKDRRNEQQKYKFRGIDDVYNTLCSVLAENKIMMLPYVREISREERQTKSGGSLNYTILTVDFDIVSAVDGSKHTVRMIGEAMDAADKSSNKAQSAALKYAALQVFMIPTEGDNDADATTHDVAPRGQRQQQAPQVINDKQRDDLLELINSAGVPVDQVCGHYKVQSLKEMTIDRYEHCVKTMKAKIAKQADKPNDIQY